MSPALAVGEHRFWRVAAKAHWSIVAAGVLAAFPVACGGDSSVETGGTGGAATQGGGAGSSFAGTRASGGASGSAASGGVSSMGGTAAGGEPAGGGGSIGGASGGGAGGGLWGGSAGSNSAGGVSGDANSGGQGGDAPDEDRCSVANYDASAPPQVVPLSGNLGTHDPVVIEANGQFYLFSTGDNLGAKRSSDLRQWTAAPEVFDPATRPAWLGQQVPGVSNLWAPDISRFGGLYHLYFSASTFGSNRSCIGHLTREVLDSGSWTDHGPVICSNVTTDDDWNAIDPNVVVDREGTAWLAFGSFWSGIKLIRLDANGERADDDVLDLASRPNAGGALEAPFIVRRCGFYYLFVSWDSCCQGANSTYNLRVGRSESVTGPYVDESGTPMLEGGGTLVLQGNGRWRGPGHNAVLFVGSTAYNVYHSYDANQSGAPTLRIAELAWNESGWPISAGP